jgi:hypothetical protein
VATRSTQSESRPSAAEAQLERTLQALRTLWAARDVEPRLAREAIAAYRELIPATAATHEMHSTLERGVARLERLPDGLDDRRTAVEHLAAELKALKPRLGLLEPATEMGVLNIAAGEKRAGRNPAPNKRPP